MSEGQDLPPWPEQDRGSSPQGEPASVLARFGARVIDSILLAVVAGLLTVLIFGVLFDVDTESSPFASGWSGVDVVVSILSVLLSIGYAAWFESTRGQTLGKMALRIAVRGPGAAPRPPIDVAVKRNLWMALSIVPLIGPLAQLVAMIAIAVTINANRNGAGWHDGWAGGTHVVKV
jgi:uncharacterized RDD family membrane protein YckC